jgi:D-arabinose 1-dehydrogenase-like Zn-dependent alcohol dehydrogenase
MCDCLKVEEILVIAGQLLPKNNEVTDEYAQIQFNYCAVCGTDLSTLEDET